MKGSNMRPVFYMSEVEVRWREKVWWLHS